MRMRPAIATAVMVALAVGLINANADMEEVKETVEATVAKLKTKVDQGRKSLDQMAKERKYLAVDDSMQELHEVVIAATERAKLLSVWDVEAIKKDAEKTFDATIGAIEDYLSLVADDGPVHRASNRIRTAALDHARTFREKAGVKNTEKYTQLAESMDKRAVEVSGVWEAIRKERSAAEAGLKELKQAKELYVDVKTAWGIEKAVEELKKVQTDLKKLSDSMVKVQKAVTEAPAVSSALN